MCTLFAVLTLVFGSIVYFLTMEFVKKFRVMADFIKDSDQLVRWRYFGAKQEYRKPGMRNVVLRGSRPFKALIGFKLGIFGKWGYDYYGMVRSDEQGVAVISTYLGKGPCTFQFLLDRSVELCPTMVSSCGCDQQLQPDVTYPPHWWQRLGFWG